MSVYDQLPTNVSLEIAKFLVALPEEDLQDLKNLVRSAKLGPKTYENMRSDGNFGLTYEWMSNAKAHWENQFNWRSVESRINSFPNFVAQVIDDDGSVHKVHFVALFSDREDAVPLMCIHGWPGSFLEFLGVLSALRTRYSSSELPYHIIVPSLPGYAFSSPPPLDMDWRLEDSARLMHKLMVGLGFEAGYALQGGDIGSYTTRIMASLYDSCKGLSYRIHGRPGMLTGETALHLNFCVITCPDEAVHGRLPIEEFEKKGLERGDDFAKFGTAYALEHSTRPSTIGFALSSSPLALLAWVGEKFLRWTDNTPSLDQILESVTLYWLTETFPRSIYPYRQELIERPQRERSEDDIRRVFSSGPDRYMVHNDPKYYCSKPFGYSWFPKEIAPVPRSWAATTGNLVWFKEHTEGGHFAAMEQPGTLLADIEAFLSQVFP